MLGRVPWARVTASSSRVGSGDGRGRPGSARRSAAPGGRESRGAGAAALPRLHVIAGDEVLAGAGLSREAGRDAGRGGWGADGGAPACSPSCRRRGSVEVAKPGRWRWRRAAVIADRGERPAGCGDGRGGGGRAPAWGLDGSTVRRGEALWGRWREGFLVGRSIHAPRAGGCAGGWRGWTISCWVRCTRPCRTREARPIGRRCGGRGRRQWRWPYPCWPSVGWGWGTRLRAARAGCAWRGGEERRVGRETTRRGPSHATLKCSTRRLEP